MMNNEEIFSKTDDEYTKIDKATAKARKLFNELTALQELGKYGSEVWNKTFAEYRVVFKKANGYAPHWAR